MSGRPNPQEVKELYESLKDFYSTRDRVSELKKSILEYEKSLELRQTELRGLEALIRGKLEHMDVASPGNFGWEARYFEMLLLMSQV